MATIKDIARIAGVSTSTVSHVVNHTRFVSPELEERVRRAIQESDALPNFVAKKLSRQQAQTEQPFVLLLMSNKDSYFQCDVERHVKDLLRGLQIGLVSFAYSESRQSLDLCLNTLLSATDLVGVILIPDDDETAARQVIKRTKLPVVVAGQSMDGVSVDMVCSDTFGGAFMATWHLIRNGHENIALLSGTNRQGSQRLAGYREALEKHNIAYDAALAHTGLSDEQSVADAMNRLMVGSIRPSAVLVANSALTLHTLQYLGANNILCPDDLSLVCFNDFQWSGLLTPPLTVVDQDAEAVARCAVELLRERLQAGGALREIAPKSILVPARLKVRASTCGIAHGPFGEMAEKPEALALNSEEISMLNERNYTAAISLHYTGKAWMDLTIKGINQVFEQVGISLIAITDAHFDPQLQSKQLQSIAMLEPDVLIAISTDNVRTAEAFQSIASSPTKLVLLTNIPDGLGHEDYACCVSVNEHAHGRNIGIGLAEYMQRHRLTKLGMLKHDADFYATSQRDRSAEQVLTEEYPELELCAIGTFTHELGTYDATRELMLKQPQIEALYIPWDGPADEAMRALSDIGRVDVCIATGDLDLPSALVLARGGMIKMISAQSPYEQGMASALAAAGALLGKKMPKYVAIEPISITPSNLLKAWKTVFKEDAPQQIRDALKQNPAYITGGV